MNKKGDKMSFQSKNISSKKTNQIVKFDINNTVLDGVLFVLDRQSSWTGTMTDLRSRLIEELGTKRDLPRSPSALRVTLNRVVNRLRTRGVSVRFGRTTDHSRTRYVRFAL